MYVPVIKLNFRINMVMYRYLQGICLPQGELYKCVHFLPFADFLIISCETASVVLCLFVAH